MANLQDTFAQRQAESANKIGDLYNQQYNAKAASLKNDYDMSVAQARNLQSQIAPQYQQQANSLASNYERQRRNMNLQALNSGLNTGTALQQQDAYNRLYQQNYAALRGSEAQAQTEANQKIVDLGTAYQNQLNQARAAAENDKAAALIKDQNTQNEWYEQQAKLLSGYGDFSGYEQLFGADTAKQMKEVWIIQHPEQALGAGLIDKKRYKKITGHAAGTK